MQVSSFQLPKMHMLTVGLTLCLSILLTACGGGSSSSTSTPQVNTDNTNTQDDPANDQADTNPDDDNQDQNQDQGQDNDDNTQNQAPSALDDRLSNIIAAFDWDTSPLADRDLPSIESPLAQLGKKLFFSKSLGGNFDSACASCHHPMLGGADDLSLPVGVDALNPELLGEGREHFSGLPLVPRNSPTNFNVGLWDAGLFHDSRVESLGKEAGANGSLSAIRTPDSDFLIADPNAGENLVSAQARFPVTSTEEMKSEHFEVGSDNATIRAHLAARIGDYGVGAGELARNDWLQAFQQAYGSTANAETLITFDNIAHALGEYQRSLVFVQNPWQDYIDGDISALNDAEKQGAILFFTAVDDGGAGCVNCHRGTLLSDELHHTIAFPQIGPGKGDGNNDDFGRERETGAEQDRYRFRTPTLLNIAQTAPYGHAGAYESLRDVVEHYRDPQRSINRYFDNESWCDLEQFENVNNCESLYSEGEANTRLALAKLEAERRSRLSLFQSPRLNDTEINQLVAFMEALTDPCIEDRTCLAAWIADENNDNPDDQVLIAEDEDGNLL